MDEILVCMYLGKNTGILTGSYTLVNHISSYGTFRYPSLNVLPQKIFQKLTGNSLWNGNAVQGWNISS